jgi:hypothetical protein
MRNAILVLAGLLVVGVVGISRGTEDQRTPGRYQLVSGRISVIGNEARSNEGLFRLNTETGEVDQYVVLQTSGDNHGRWIPLRSSSQD